MQNRQIFIGDVHGCLEELEELLNKVNFSSTDELFFLGDIINKGPNSLEVLKLVKDLNAHLILGNHELKFIKNIEENTPSKFSRKLQDKMGNDLKKWVSWLKSKPLFISREDFILVHAGLSPNEKLKNTSPRILTNIRTWDGNGKDISSESNPPWYEFYKNEKLVIFGHWAKKGLVIRDNAIGLDSGCVYGNKLSALILPGREIISVDAKKAHCPID